MQRLFYLMILFLGMLVLCNVIVGRLESFSLLAKEQLLGYMIFNQWTLFTLPSFREKDFFILSWKMQSKILLQKYLLLGTLSYGWLYLYTDLCTYIIGMKMGLYGIFSIIISILLQQALFRMAPHTSVLFCYTKGLLLLGGVFAPIHTYPFWLRTLCNLSPFPVILGARSALWFACEDKKWLLAMTGWMLCALAVWFIAIKLPFKRSSFENSHD